MGFKREDIRNVTPLDIKKINDNFMNMWQKMFGNIDFADLSKSVQKSMVTQGNAGTTIEQNWESVQIAWNNISDVIQFIDGYLKISHSDGSYSKLSADGLQKYVAGTGKNYFYQSTSVQFSGEQSQYFYTINIPPEFVGKNPYIIPYFKSVDIKSNVTVDPEMGIQQFSISIYNINYDTVEIYAFVNETTPKNPVVIPSYPYRFDIIVDFIA